MVFKLQGAHGVRDLFQRVRLAVGKIIERVDNPLVAGAMMRLAQNAIHHRIAHVQVGRSHVDLGPQAS
jgi:hypothetical protein